MPSLITKLFDDGKDNPDNQWRYPAQGAIGNLTHRPQNEVNQTSKNEQKTYLNTHSISFLVL